MTKRRRDGDDLLFRGWDRDEPPLKQLREASLHKPSPLATRVLALMERDETLLKVVQKYTSKSIRPNVSGVLASLVEVLCGPRDLGAWLDKTSTSAGGVSLAVALEATTIEVWKITMRLVARVRRGCPLVEKICHKNCANYENGAAKEDQMCLHAYVYRLGARTRARITEALGLDPDTQRIEKTLPLDFALPEPPMSFDEFVAYKSLLARWMERFVLLMDALVDRGLAFLKTLDGKRLRDCVAADVAHPMWQFLRQPGAEKNVVSRDMEVFQAYHHMSVLYAWSMRPEFDVHIVTFREKIRNQKVDRSRVASYRSGLAAVAESLTLTPPELELYVRYARVLIDHDASKEIDYNALALKNVFCWDPFPSHVTYRMRVSTGALRNPVALRIDDRPDLPAPHDSFQGAVPLTYMQQHRSFNAERAKEWKTYADARRCVFGDLSGWTWKDGAPSSPHVPSPARFSFEDENAALLGIASLLETTPDVHPNSVVHYADQTTTVFRLCGGADIDAPVAGERFDMLYSLFAFSKSSGYVEMGIDHPLYVRSTRPPTAFALLSQDFRCTDYPLPAGVCVPTDVIFPVVVFFGLKEPLVVHLTGERANERMFDKCVREEASFAARADIDAMCSFFGVDASDVHRVSFHKRGSADYFSHVRLNDKAYKSDTYPCWLFVSLWDREARAGNAPPFGCVPVDAGGLRIVSSAHIESVAKRVCADVHKLMGNRLCAWMEEGASVERSHSSEPEKEPKVAWSVRHTKRRGRPPGSLSNEAPASEHEAPCGKVGDPVVVHSFHASPDDEHVIDPLGLCHLPPPGFSKEEAVRARFVDRLVPVGKDKPRKDHVASSLWDAKRTTYVRNAGVNGTHAERNSVNKCADAPAYCLAGRMWGPQPFRFARAYPPGAACVGRLGTCFMSTNESEAKELACDESVRARAVFQTPSFASLYPSYAGELEPIPSLVAFLRKTCNTFDGAGGSRYAISDVSLVGCLRLTLSGGTLVETPERWPDDAPPVLSENCAHARTQLDRMLAEHWDRASWPRAPDVVRVGYLCMSLAPTHRAFVACARECEEFASSDDPTEAYARACSMWGATILAEHADGIACSARDACVPLGTFVEDVRAFVSERTAFPLEPLRLGPAFALLRKAGEIVVSLMVAGTLESKRIATATEACWALDTELRHAFERPILEAGDEPWRAFASFANALYTLTHAGPDPHVVNDKLKPSVGPVFCTQRGTKGSTQGFTKSLSATNTVFKPIRDWLFCADFIETLCVKSGTQASTPLSVAQSDTVASTTCAWERWDIATVNNARVNCAKQFLGKQADMQSERHAKHVKTIAVTCGEHKGIGNNIIVFKRSDAPRMMFTYVACHVPVTPGSDVHVHVHLNQCKASCYDFVLDAERIERARADGDEGYAVTLTPWFTTKGSHAGKFWTYAKMHHDDKGDAAIVSLVVAIGARKFEMRSVDDMDAFVCGSCEIEKTI